MVPSVHSSPSREKQVPPFRRFEREALCAVFEDCVDQLAVLGGIVPNYAEKPSAVDVAMGGELKQILEKQRQLEQQFELITTAEQLKEQAYSINATAQVARSAKAVLENMQKLQRDRSFLQGLMSDTMEELAARGTFATLTARVQEYHSEKRRMEETILHEESCRKRVRQLKHELMELKKQREEELLQLNEQVAHYKDQLQELKAKTNLETKFLKKECQVRVEISQRHQANLESGMSLEEEQLKQQIEEEARVSQAIEDYLKNHYEELAGKVDYWMTRHEQDLDMKMKDLHELKQNKATGLMKMDEMSKLYREYEDVVVEHRAMKERQRLKAEQEERERKASIKLQSWWRGVMVRKGLGPYAKKKKGKKGKGKGKKGKKGKKKK